MMAADKQPVRPLGAIVREAMHTVAMECGPFTAAELVEFDKIAAGTKKTEQYRAEILAENEDRQMDAIVKAAATAAIARTHAAGRPTTHADNKGIYRLYPDGHKIYIELYEQESGKTPPKTNP